MGTSKAGLRLAHIGSREFPYLRSYASFLELILQDSFVIALQVERCLVAQNSEICRCRIEKKLLLGALKFGSSHEYLLLSSFRFRFSAKTSE